jgi:hypothetical protein
MGEVRTLDAIAESCPFDVLLVRDMKAAVSSLLQLNLKRFRIPQKTIAHYSALDVMKQALELLYEFSPSEKNYREAMRTIQVYSEGDQEMLRVLQTSFFLIADAVYCAYSGQRYAESLAPEILFLQGILFDPSELQQSFRFVGVRPPEVSPPTVRTTVFLDEGFEPYRLMLEGKKTVDEADVGREEHWAQVIESTLSKKSGKALIRAGTRHVDQAASPLARLFADLIPSRSGKLSRLLQRRGIAMKVVHRISAVNEVYGKNWKQNFTR